VEKVKMISFKIKPFILALLIAVSTTFSGCFDASEIDDLAYVVAIGFDKGENNFLKMTLQIAIPKNIGSGEGGGGGGEKTTTITTVETPTIYTGLNMINNYISREINLSHAKTVVFSEELAREGIHDYVHAMVRGREFRPNMYVVVARNCAAEDYIKNVEPELEVNPSKYYEMNYNSFKYTGFTAPSTLINFYLQEECTCSQAVATLAGLNMYKSSEEFTNLYSTYKEKDRNYPFGGDFKAGNLPKTGTLSTEIMGLAVFDGGKMVGDLDGDESNFYLMLTGKYNHSYLTIPDPLSKDKFILLNIKLARPPVKRVKMTEGIPEIYAKVRLEADILSIQSGKNYESTKNSAILEMAAQEHFKKGMLRFLEKTAREYESDICQFGKAIKGQFLTWEQWVDFNWLSRYKDSTFNVEVELKLRRPGLMVKTTPAYSSKGEEMD
jgi:spore germination protein KC